MTKQYDAIYKAVSAIPEGHVATYGQIAALAGYPRCARQVGYALSALTAQSKVPWHRVINAKGEVSQRADPDASNYQYLLLEQEGIVFSQNGRIALSKYQWAPVLK